MSPEVLSAIEKEMVKMYGEGVIIHPEVWWDTEKEKKYKEELKKINDDPPQEQQIPVSNEVLIISKLFTNSFRTCEICESNFCGYYDELYLNKFKCCYKCYIMFCEGREDKWEMRRKELIQKKK